MALPDTSLVVAVTAPAEPPARRALRDYYQDIGGRYYGRPLTEAEIDDILAEDTDEDLRPPTGWFWVATLGGRVAGCIGLRYVTEDGTRVGELTRVYVSAAVRRQGLGSRLITTVERQATADGVTALRLDVRTDLVEARALYTRHGFHEAPAFNDSPYAGHWLRKTLR
ncbi:GNAT family N-acetyltransferase [Dactylosporangium aurantiacum]|uniref:GNAT family N-acetyltransferase n=1 Tax=Dactylosporangium aurantiacum TaxID=35754 RepID=A0A9Q9MHL4_9ACTN|nr:GNAT family N-acetyltransferase [Dactylosporangium aurantiacum]MDG6109847.1 GNAT family N-acetyltransferase [Dactylosporangium aurantiacum]UWZ59603.1 GNAT family N-acetyltransferase [Dactylosporangium aurantiacum]